MRAIDDDQRLAELWDVHARRLHAYARRHADTADADDLVADAYVVALRRLRDIPDDSGEAFAWLVVTVRKLAANQRRRSATRDQYWAQAVRDLWHAGVGLSAEDVYADRERSIDALARLTEDQRETLLLIAWEGLTHGQAAQVLGCSVNTFSVRLHRARTRLQAALDLDSTPLRVTTSQEIR